MLVAAGVVTTALILIDTDDAIAAYLPGGVVAVSLAPLHIGRGTAARVSGEVGTNGKTRVGERERRREIGVGRALEAGNVLLSTGGREALPAALAAPWALCVRTARARTGEGLHSVDRAALLRRGIENVAIIAA